MKPIAIIAEFNPFHQGHDFLLTTLRSHVTTTTPLIIILSGSFVQRGEPALFTKWRRAAWAIQSGADVVLELPTVYALSAAPAFAAGAVRLAALIGCQQLAFGSEIGTAHDFYEIYQKRKKIEQIPFSPGNYTYGQYITNQLRPLLTPTQQKMLDSPNALLGIEYEAARSTYASKMELYPILRSNRHDSMTIEKGFASGSLLRKAFQKNDTAFLHAYLPQIVKNDLNDIRSQGEYTDYTRYGDFILYALRQQSLDTLRTLPAFSEGLEQRFLHVVSHSSTWHDALCKLKTRRYSYRRLCRMGSYIVLHPAASLFQQAYKEGPPYARILGLSPVGRKFIKQSSAVIPYVSKIPPFLKQASLYAKEMMSLDMQATDLQHLSFVGSPFHTGNIDFYHPPYILPD